MNRSIIYIIFLVCSYLHLSGQDPQFTQFYANKLYLAPSFAGATQEDRLSLVYRNQWPTLPGTFVTYCFSYDHYFSNFNSGLGFLFLRDLAGSGNLGTTNFGIQYSYDVKINDMWHIRPGAHFIYTQTGLNFEKLLWNDQISPDGITSTTQQSPGVETKGDVDFSTSAITYSDKIWAGFTVDHLLKPKTSLYGNDTISVPLKISVFGGTRIFKKGSLLNPINESLSVAFLFKTQDKTSQMDLGVYWYKSPLMLGLWYRGIPIVNKEKIGDAIALLIGYKTESFSVGYSYDFTISRLVSSTGGSHEISLIYEFQTSRETKKRHMVPCPEF